jgi:hypothetical protein
VDFLPSVAAAEELSTFRLSWLRGEGAESCPSAQELERAVQSRLGRDPFAENAEQAIEASVARSGDATWHIQIRVRDAGGKKMGSRELDTEASDCRAIADALALAVALAIDPDAELGPPPPPLARVEPATVPPKAPAACPAPPACPGPAPCRCPPPTRATVHATFTGRALLAGGILPGVASGAGMSGDLAISRWHATLGFYWLAETKARGFAFGLSAASVGGCVDAIRSESTTLGLCTGVQFGAMHSVVRDPNLRPDGPGERLWVALEFGPRLSWRGPGPFYAELGGSLLAPLTRPAFGVRLEPNPRFQPDMPCGVGFAGLGVAVP